MPETSQRRACLEVSAGVRRICRIRIRSRKVIDGSWKNNAGYWHRIRQCGGEKHARASRSWKKRNLSEFPHADGLEYVPACTLGTKGRNGNSRNVLLPETFRPDVTQTQETVHDRSLIFAEMKKENELKVHKYGKPAHLFPVESVYLTPPEFYTSPNTFFFADRLVHELNTPASHCKAPTPEFCSELRLLCLCTVSALN